jgi:hypothetical protein
MIRLRFINIIGILVLSILFTGCPIIDPDDTADFRIINRSNEDIVWIFRSRTDIDQLNYNPWTSTASGKVVNSMEDIKSENRYVKAGDTKITYLLEPGYKETLKEVPIKYYIFSYDSVCTIPWERIRDEHIWLKKVTFYSWEDMEACNFTVTWP